VKEWTASAGLTLHPTKTRLVDERKDGFDFLLTAQLESD
jgi:RNA-directed DNA polymerase